MELIILCEIFIYKKWITQKYLNGIKKVNRKSIIFFLPSPSLRALIIGSSNCGKTCLLLKLLLTEKWLDYNDLYIYSNSLHQPEYKLMKIAFRKGYDKGDIWNFLANSNEDIDKFLKTLPQKFYKPVINSKMFDSSEIIPDPKDFNPKRKSLFIFDDIMTEKNQDPASNFYTRGRHNNCSCIYISQNYHKLPRQTIRTNSNLLILFSIPKKIFDIYMRTLYLMICHGMNLTRFAKMFSILNILLYQ